MTDCLMDEMRDLLPQLALGALAPADEARVRAHAAACDACRAELALLETLRVRFDAATPAISVAAITVAIQAATVPAAGKESARAARDLRLVRPASRRGNWMPRRYLAAAASLLLVGSLSLAVLGRMFGGSSVGVDTEAGTVGSVTDSAPAAIAAAASGLVVADGLADLDAESLNTLLAELEQVEATVAAEPVSMRQPIVDTPGGF